MFGPIIALLIIATVSLVIVRLGASALALTGLSREIANFQATSAFFGVGFTTQEAEHVVRHPLRRRIITHLIICGNVGLTSALATIIITAMDVRTSEQIVKPLGTLLLGFGVLYLVFAKTGIVQHVIDWTVKQSLTRIGQLRIADYELLLKAKSGFCVSEVKVAEGTEITRGTLGDSRPADRGIIVLGITHANGSFTGTPKRHEEVVPGDVLLVYGHEDAIESMHQRHSASSPA